MALVRRDWFGDALQLFELMHPHAEGEVADEIARWHRLMREGGGEHPPPTGTSGGPSSEGGAATGDGPKRRRRRRGGRRRRRGGELASQTSES